MVSSSFILASSFCKSLQCLISVLTQRGEGGHLFSLTCSVGREEHCKQISLACVGSARSVWTTLGLPQLTVACAFQVYTAQAPGCSAGELSKVGPGLCALPRSKPLRFRFSGTPQRHRLSWACVLCPSQVQAAQVTKCWASSVAATYRLPHPCHSVFWVYNQRTFSGRC